MWFLPAVALSAAVSWFVASRTVPDEGDRHGESAGASDLDFHEWTHARLELTPEQEEKLGPIESDYDERRGELVARIESAGRSLAHAFGAGDEESETFRGALEEFQRAQGELQRLTLEHFFDMKRHLSPDQAEKLRKWIHDSIAHEHRH